MWRQFLGEGFKEYMTIIRTCDARSMHHTCGMVTPLVGEMVARGLQILQSLQPEAMVGDYASLKSTYGRRLAFQGGISIQQTLPRGTPKQVREEVRQRIETLAPAGGYILCTAHNIQADCPLENVTALFCAYREFGRYNNGQTAP
jgi:uroporphyrinogen decarboxylase